MAIGLVGRKCGMTRVFTDAGESIPVTVVEALPNRITQLKTEETDGYRAVQVTTGSRKASRVRKPQQAHFAKAGVEPGRGMWEFRLGAEEGADLEAGGELTVDVFSDGQPVDVIGLGALARGVASGHQHSCALTDQGGVRCWGDGGDGRLGNGTYYGDGSPVSVIGLRDGVASVSAGDYHNCAITVDGRALCWGSNEWGQLGDGTREDRYAPVPVQGLEDGVVAISAGSYHSCAVTVVGELYCWGNPSYGQLGTQSVWATVPVTVGGFGP